MFSGFLQGESYTNNADFDFIWRYEPWLLMGEQKSSVLLHIQTDRQVILDPGRTNWPVSPTQVNQESEGVGRTRQTDRDRGKHWTRQKEEGNRQKDDSLQEKIIEN